VCTVFGSKCFQCNYRIFISGTAEANWRGSARRSRCWQRRSLWRSSQLGGCKNYGRGSSPTGSEGPITTEGGGGRSAEVTAQVEEPEV
jgi:hypothetical protein